MNMIKPMLKKHYGLTVDSVEELDIKSVNDLFKVETKKGTYFLKKSSYLRGRNVEDIQAHVDIALHMDKKGIPVVLPIKNKQKKYLTKVGTDCYILYPYEELDARESFTHQHMETAARMLAKFHKAGEDYKAKTTFYTKALHEDIESITEFTEAPSNFRTDSVMAKVKRSKSPFSKRVKKDSPMIKEAIIRVVHSMWGKEFSKKSLLHYDFGPGNVFFKNGSLFAISDYDFSHVGYVETDVVKAARFWAMEEDGNLNPVKFKRFITVYAEENTIDLDWEVYQNMVLYLVLRRLVHAASYTLDDSQNDLEFLYDVDIKVVKFLMENKI